MLDFFKGILTRRPVFAPFTTPIYSNSTYQILSYVLETITGKNFSSMLEDDVLKRLDPESSSYTLPAIQSAGLTPGDPYSLPPKRADG